jgi:hypothetical protein
MRMQKLKFVKKETPYWTTGMLVTPSGSVHTVATAWTRPDYWGMIKSRISGFRMNYAVTPGLYAVGGPTKGSDVFVTANYKLTFDILRRALHGMSAWILVLDTKSINVWCAAGKGPFGTDELIKRMTEARLDALVSHRRIILPQLGAVGVNASTVQKRTGFRVSFGPVDARDISAYVGASYQKTEVMSTIRFSMLDRLVLTPMELNPAMKKFPWIAGGILVFFGLQPHGLLFHEAWSQGMPFLLLALLAVFAGAFVTPVLLPFVPFRSFALKGWIVGVLLVFAAAQSVDILSFQNTSLLLVSYLLLPALSSYLTLQFTGATTFTGMSGVKKELKLGIPFYTAAAGISLVLLIVYKLKEWGVF